MPGGTPIKEYFAKAKSRKENRLAKAAWLWSKSAANGLPCPAKPKKAVGHTKRRKVPSRRRALNRLKESCRLFVMLRCKNTKNGMCEIAMCCGGTNVANTWYHGWPQKGGNGLKYDARSHFASCGPCNMGEYGARMHGSPLYINRHKEILGPLWEVLDKLHGRRQITTAEANLMADDYERRIIMKEWYFQN